jgi:hypothetical protein
MDRLQEKLGEMSEAKYRIGDIVQWALSRWALGSTAGESYFIGHLKADAKNRVLILATAAEVGIEIDSEHCRPTGHSHPSQGQTYRERYARQRPGRLRSNA